MVRIHVKHACRNCHDEGGESCDLEFLFDCETFRAIIGHISKELVELANFQLRIHQLASHLLPHLSRALSEASSYASKDQVIHGKPLSSIALREHMRRLETDFAANYHQLDFPDAKFDPILSDVEVLQEDKVQLLWAAKDLMKGKALVDYIGRNEKTKIILRLLSRNSHPTCEATAAALASLPFVTGFDGFLQFQFKPPENGIDFLF